jgi:hypothetical protein
MLCFIYLQKYSWYFLCREGSSIFMKMYKQNNIPSSPKSGIFRYLFLPFEVRMESLIEIHVQCFCSPFLKNQALIPQFYTSCNRKVSQESVTCQSCRGWVYVPHNFRVPLESSPLGPAWARQGRRKHLPATRREASRTSTRFATTVQLSFPYCSTCSANSTMACSIRSCPWKSIMTEATIR